MFVNLTPHPISLSTPSGVVTIPPSGTVARVATVPGQPIGVAGGVELYSAPSYGAVDGVPDAVEGTIYIVSAMVATRLVGRTDVFSPGTGPSDGAIRDDTGRIVAVTRLIQAPAA